MPDSHSPKKQKRFSCKTEMKKKKKKMQEWPRSRKEEDEEMTK